MTVLCDSLVNVNVNTDKSSIRGIAIIPPRDGRFTQNVQVLKETTQRRLKAPQK